MENIKSLIENLKTDDDAIMNNITINDLRTTNFTIQRRRDNDSTGLLTEKYLKKRITQSVLFNAIDGEYWNNEEALQKLYTAYPEQFKSALKYIVTKKKTIINTIINNNTKNKDELKGDKI